MEINGQPHEPAALPPQQSAPGIHLKAGWVSPAATLGGLGEEKLLILRATAHQMVESLA